MSNSSDFLGGSGGSGGATGIQVVLQSRTVTFRKTGKVRLSFAGGAGAGAAAVGVVAAAPGGATGGFLQLILDVIAGQQAVITLGAGATATALQTGAGIINGGAGGTSTVVIGAKTLTCPGGGGGVGVTGSTAAAVSAPGAVGGVPTGGVVATGDAVCQGGGSGSILGAGATGGGALNLLGLAAADIQSGSITLAAAFQRATGGASPGGKSGNVSTTTGATGGGGMGGPSAINSGIPGPDAYGAIATTTPAIPVRPSWITSAASPIYLDGGGSAGANIVTPAYAASNVNGGGSGAITHNTNTIASLAAGLMAGSGGACLAAGASSFDCVSGAGGIMGGASGGAANSSTNASATARAGKAGDGWAIIEELS